MAFTRTPGGLTEKWRFHRVPTVWLEGPTDLFFYEPISSGLSCRFESFHGYKNAEALIHALKEHDYPYLIILDGDYSILKRAQRSHRRVLILSRYSYENFLWVPDAINRACLRHARCGDQKDLVVSAMSQAVDDIKKELLPAVILDVAARRMDPAPKVLPERIESLLADRTGIRFDSKQLRVLISKAKKEVGRGYLRDAKRDVSAFLVHRCVSHLICGHLLFGLLRRIFVQAANLERGSKSVSSDDALLQMLSDAIWKYCKEGDHKRLKRAFRSKVRELARSFS